MLWSQPAEPFLMRVRPRLSVLALFAVTALTAGGGSVVSGQTTDAPKPKSTRATPQIIQGCLTGSIISSIEVDEVSAPLELPPGATLRLAGAKDLVRSLKKEHNGHLLELSGKMKGSFGPPTPTRSFGGVSVGINGAHAQGPNTPSVPSMPSFDVKAFRYVGDCAPAVPR
jgi:hypothetical protein